MYFASVQSSVKDRGKGFGRHRITAVLKKEKTRRRKKEDILLFFVRSKSGGRRGGRKINKGEGEENGITYYINRDSGVV